MNTKVTAPNLRLRSVLADQRKRWGSYDKLAQQIAFANKNDVGIDRRKLRGLIEGENVSLRISELVALDTYLSPLGEGLATKTLFERPSILAELSQRGSLTFMLGSYPLLELHKEQQRLYMGKWDIQAMATFLRDLNQHGTPRFDIQEVPVNESENAAVDAGSTWMKWKRDDAQSIVSVGSSRVNLATEHILAEMAAVDPFVPPDPLTSKLPFHFVWPNDLPDFRSAFAISGEAIKNIAGDLSADIMQEGSKSRGLQVGKKVYAEFREREGGKRKTKAKSGQSKESLTYGLIAAQRRRTGNLWVVTAGLSGPGTFAAAKSVGFIIEDIPLATETGQHSPVLWAIVEVAIKTGDNPYDPRETINERLVEGPHVWQPSKSKRKAS